MKILSAEQIHQWDDYIIKNEPVSSVELMERAAAKCVEWIEAKNFAGKNVKIFCGKGNNGGDGLAIARLLSKQRFSIEVFILELGVAGKNDFEANLNRLHSGPVAIHFLQHSDFFPEIDINDLVVDALFGTGLTRSLDDLAAQLVHHINESKATIIAVDIPSGMFADKTSVGNAMIKAAFALTFQTIKMCFLFPENEEYFGDVIVLDIGLSKDFLATQSSRYELTDRDLIRQIYKPRKTFSHKGIYGHALIIAGEKGKMGAAVLCSKACLRAGAGLVSAMVPEEQFAIIQTALPEAMVMSHEEVEEVDWSKYAAIGVGPGIGTKEEGARLVQKVLAAFNKPIVIDADGLNILSANPELLAELPPGSILSPHPKEFERLFGKSEDQPQRIQTALANAKQYFVYIIVKGHNSVLACPDGEVFFNSTGNAGMAKGGSGDVLTGILTALLAQHYSPRETCLLGMYLHGLSADIAVTFVSKEALMAGDIVENLGKAFLSISY